MRELKKTLKSKLWSELEEKLYKEPHNQNVRKNLLGKTTQAIKEYSTPFLNSYAIYKIFN